MKQKKSNKGRMFKDRVKWMFGKLTLDFDYIGVPYPKERRKRK